MKLDSGVAVTRHRLVTSEKRTHSYQTICICELQCCSKLKTDNTKRTENYTIGAFQIIRDTIRGLRKCHHIAQGVRKCHVLLEWPHTTEYMLIYVVFQKQMLLLFWTVYLKPENQVFRYDNSRYEKVIKVYITGRPRYLQYFYLLFLSSMLQNFILFKEHKDHTPHPLTSALLWSFVRPCVPNF